MSNKAILVAIVIGLLVLCAIVVFIAAKVVEVNNAIDMSQDLMFYCHTGSRTLDECQAWTTDVLNNHRKEIVKCADETYSLSGCIESLGLQP